jgi:DNA replication and repair protein RecF
VALERLEIRRLRCVTAADLALDQRRNLIDGANGAGKTSILEAAHVLGRGHSFRVRDNRRLIQRGEAGFLVRGAFVAGQRPARIGVEYRQGTLSVHIDGQAHRRASELAAALPIEVIDPAAHSLIDGSPGERRRFLDWGLFHVEHGYMTHWQAYRRVLLQRNQALRNAVSDAELDVWDEAFVSAAGRLDTIRARFVEAWSEETAAIGARLLGAEPGIVYRPGHAQEKTLVQALEEGRARERAREMTLVGPHRSDLVIDFGGGRAREVASRGQQKLLAAALILGRLAHRVGRGGAPGLLLVDDPAAELDSHSLQRLVQELVALPAQMLVTSIDAVAMSELQPARMFHVEQGVIESS